MQPVFDMRQRKRHVFGGEAKIGGEAEAEKWRDDSALQADDGELAEIEQPRNQALQNADFTRAKNPFIEVKNIFNALNRHVFP